LIGLEDVRRAAERLHGVAHRTPVLTSRTLDRRTGASLSLKAENLQRGGAFKFRGAYNRISSLERAALDRGVAAYSSGNHAQAVALAALLLRSHAVILMPEDAPPEKLDATRGYGAEVITYDRYREDREQLGRALAENRGLTLVPPYEDPLVMAGQGTTALELLEDVEDLEVLLCPIGGGGLIAGCAAAAKALRPQMEVWGVEPLEGDDTKRSLEAGERVRIPVPHTIADGLQVNVPGELSFEINRRLLDGVVTVADEDILAAMAFLFERMKTVVEPSGAAALAAVMAGTLAGTASWDGPRLAGRRVGVVLSGGNVGVERFARLMATALADPPR
jgi:threonine dehydratase